MDIIHVPQISILNLICGLLSATTCFFIWWTVDNGINEEWSGIRWVCKVVNSIQSIGPEQGQRCNSQQGQRDKGVTKTNESGYPSY